MWKGLDFHKSLIANKSKFLIDIVEMSPYRFNMLMEIMNGINNDHISLMD